MKKLAINYENVLTIKEDLKRTLNETFKLLKNVGITSLDVRYDRFFENKSLYSEILIAGMSVSSVFYVGDLGVSENYAKEMEIVDFCAEHKIPYIMLLTKPKFDKVVDKDKYLSNVKQNLRRIVNYANIYNIKVGIENFGLQNSAFSSFKNVKNILNSVRGLYLVFDSGNFFLAGENPFVCYKELEDKISKVHLKDRGISNGKGRNEQTSISGESTCVYPLGEGESNVLDILNQMKESGVFFDCSLEFDFVAHDIFEDVERSAIYYYSEEA